jgi:hypothetical protein
VISLKAGLSGRDISPRDSSCNILQMTKDDFISRFTDRVVFLCSEGRRPLGRLPREYAKGVAPIYWMERHPEGLSPERCALEDAMWWEDEPLTPFGTPRLVDYGKTKLLTGASRRRPQFLGSFDTFQPMLDIICQKAYRASIPRRLMRQGIKLFYWRH